ncbi:uncharacterized protein METZ01_LOCUS221937, partial [marine metagenome]
MKRLFSIIILAQLTFLNADNYSVSFDYMDGYASSDASSETIFQGVTSFSVETWYKNPGVVSGPNSSYSNTGSIITNYRRISGGDPYNNFVLVFGSNIDSNPGYVNFLGAVSNEQLDDDQWHHIAGVYDHDNSVSYLFIDGVLNDTDDDSGDFLSSYNKLYINNHAPFAGEYHMECDVAGLRITDGVRYSSNFSPSFPLASEANSIIALDFSTGDGTTLADLSGNGNNFSLYDAASWTTDVPEVTITNTHSLSFDGNGDYVYKDDAIFNADGNWTLSGWVYKTTTGVNYIFGTSWSGNHNQNSMGLYLNPGLKLWRRTNTSNEMDSGNYGTIATNTWQHVAVTYNGSTVTFYVDGLNVGSESWTTGTINSTDIAIGVQRRNRGAVMEHYFNGNIDEFSIWSDVLTQAEIQAYMSTSLSGSETDLVGYWNFNEGSGTTASDATSNNNDGTISGATWSTNVPFTGA